MKIQLHATGLFLILGLFGVFAFDSAWAQAGADEAAMMRACELESSPSGYPLERRDTAVKDSWKWGAGKKHDRYEFSSRRHTKAPFVNPICETYILSRLNQQAGKGVARDRCEYIRNDLYLNDAELATSSSSSVSDSSSLSSAADSFFRSSGRSSSRDDDESSNICENEDAGEEADFACSFIDIAQRLDSGSEKKAAARRVTSFCRGVGADMTPRLRENELRAYSDRGIDVFGNGYCGPRGGGTVIIERSNSHALLNAVSGIARTLAPIGAMTYIAHLQQKNAQRQIDANARLGFPSAVMAGQMGGGGVYAGHGGMINGGGACGGMAGGCPFGACPGNCGVVVGHGGMIPGGGMLPGGGVMGGGGCGIPPYALSYAGCGAGGYAGGDMRYPAGIPGAGGYAGGFPGPYGTGGYAGGAGAGAGGFPGPYGTGDGSNGWGQGGNPYGYNGQYGQPQHWGAQNPYNSQYMSAQAQMYERYATQMARQAQETAQAAKMYQSTLKDLEAVQEKSYQSYLAYQMAQRGMGGGGGYTATQSSAAAYGGNTGIYYPPYSSGGSNFSVGAGFTYSSGAQKATNTNVPVRSNR